MDIAYNLLNESVADGEEVPIFSIDDYFREQPISFLKADVEGYEWRMLHGAKKVIRRDRPKIAICVYHSAVDMYRIASAIKELCLDYRLFVRQHSHDIVDTVFYACV